MAGLNLESSFADAVILVTLLSSIPLAVSMLVGFVVSVLQAATQIQEQILSFVPKLLAVCLVLYCCGSWMTTEVTEYFTSVLKSLPQAGG